MKRSIIKTSTLLLLLCFTLSTQGQTLDLTAEQSYSDFSEVTNILEPSSFLFLNYYTSEGTTKSILVVKKNAKNLNELEKSKKRFLYLDFKQICAMHSKWRYLSFSKKNISDITTSFINYFSFSAGWDIVWNFFLFPRRLTRLREIRHIQDYPVNYTARGIIAIYLIFQLNANLTIPKNFIGFLYKASRLITSIVVHEKIEFLFTGGPLRDLSNHHFFFIRELKTLLLINLTSAALHTGEDIFFQTLEELTQTSDTKTNALQYIMSLNLSQTIILKVSDEEFKYIQKNF